MKLIAAMLKVRAALGPVASVAALLVGPVFPAVAQEREHHVVLVNVLDRDGNQVPGLSAANFRGEYRGQPVTILSATKDETPRHIALVVDVSESQKRREGAVAWKAAEEAIDLLTPRHSVVILTVAETLQKHSELTNDREALQKAIREAGALQPAGPSSLYNAVLQASLVLRGPGLGHVVCLFSDGDDTSSALDPSKMVEAVARSGVRVFVVRTPPIDLRDMGRSAHLTATYWTESITEATGGSVYRLAAFQNREAGTTLRAFYSSIADAYRLELEFPRPVDEPRRWKLAAIDPAGKKLPNVRLVYPHLVAPLLTLK